MTRGELQRGCGATNQMGSRPASCAVRMKRYVLASSLISLMTIVLAGCQPESGQTRSPELVAQTAGVRTVQELGPIHVTVEVVSAPARLSDEPTLTITVTAKAGVDVDLPPFGDAVGDFCILDFREPLVEVRGDREVIRQVYSLEPPYTGTLEIDPIVVTFTDSKSERGTQRLETEALAIEITSLVDAEAPSLDDLEGFAPPMELPQTVLWWPWIVCSLLLLFSLAVGMVWLRRRQAKAGPKRASVRVSIDTTDDGDPGGAGSNSGD